MQRFVLLCSVAAICVNLESICGFCVFNLPHFMYIYKTCVLSSSSSSVLLVNFLLCCCSVLRRNNNDPRYSCPGTPEFEIDTSQL